MLARAASRRAAPALSLRALSSWAPSSLDALIPSVPPPQPQPQEQAPEGLQMIKRTYQPSVRRRRRKFGLLNRLKRRSGRKIIQRKREKGRHNINIAGEADSLAQLSVSGRFD